MDARVACQSRMRTKRKRKQEKVFFALSFRVFCFFRGVTLVTCGAANDLKCETIRFLFQRTPFFRREKVTAVIYNKVTNFSLLSICLSPARLRFTFDANFSKVRSLFILRRLLIRRPTFLSRPRVLFHFSLLKRQ